MQANYSNVGDVHLANRLFIIFKHHFHYRKVIIRMYMTRRVENKCSFENTM